MVPAAFVDAVDRRAGAAARAGRHPHRRRQLALPRRHRAREAARGRKGLHYVDMGTSGGVWGLERGYCLMIGGETEVVKRLDPIFATLAPGRGDIPRTPGREKLGGTAEHGYLHCGPTGAGHFVKMVHNGIEYGLMAAYAEGLNILKKANIGKASARARRRDDAAAPPRALPVRLRPRRHHRGVAARQRDRLLAARPDRRGLRRRARTSTTSRARSPTPARDAGRWPRPTTRRCPPTCSRPRSSSASPRAARTTSRTACSPPCASGFGGHVEKK